jgi:hypothetical protein
MAGRRRLRRVRLVAGPVAGRVATCVAACIGILAGTTVAATLMAAPAAAQGPGSAGAQLLQFHVGARAAALAGAYTALAGDADALYYNPAGLVGDRALASASYQSHVHDVALGSFAGALRVGPAMLALGISYLDAGEIAVLTPDPAYGGQRGQETGQLASAGESALRVAAALPVGERFSIGATAGYVTTSVAGLGRSAPFADLGARGTFGAAHLGLALRHLGGSLSGDGTDAPLPGVAAAGLAITPAGPAGTALLLAAELLHRIEEGGTGFAAGIEAGLAPPGARYATAVRFGYDASGTGDEILGTVRVGAGFRLGSMALDYAFQHLEHFGPVHRFGIRWAR